MPPPLCCLIVSLGTHCTWADAVDSASPIPPTPTRIRFFSTIWLFSLQVEAENLALKEQLGKLSDACSLAKNQISELMRELAACSEGEVGAAQARIVELEAELTHRSTASIVQAQMARELCKQLEG